MLRRGQRLSASQVREVLASGRASGRGKFLSLKVKDTPSPFRVAVVVSKKVARTAVRRNSIRRTVYGALRSTSLPSKGHAILFVQTIPPEKLREAFVSDLNKLLHV